MLDFPSTPTLNQTYTSGGRTWRYDGTSWVAAQLIGSTITATQISDSSAAGRTLLTAADTSAQRTALSSLLNDIANLAAGTQSVALTYSSDGDANGVFYKIGSLSAAWANPSGAVNGVVFTPSHTPTAGAVDELTNRTTGSYQTNPADTSYIGVDLGSGRTLSLNRVSIRHSSSSLFLDALRDWKIQGSNNVSANTAAAFNVATWVDLDVNVANTAIQNYNDWYTKVPSAGVTTAFRYFRLVQTGVNSNGNWRLNLGELEFYGTFAYTTAAAANGSLTFNGTTITTAAASGGGSNSIFVGAGEMIPRSTTGAGINSSETTTNRINYDTVDFDTATQEFAQFVRILPNNYNGGTVTAKFLWTADSGTVGAGVVFALAARALSDDDAIDSAFGTQQQVTDALLAASDVHISAATPAVTIGGVPANGKPIVFEVRRVPADAADTLAVDARLIGVEITYAQ